MYGAILRDFLTEGIRVPSGHSKAKQSWPVCGVPKSMSSGKEVNRSEHRYNTSVWTPNKSFLHKRQVTGYQPLAV